MKVNRSAAVLGALALLALAACRHTPDYRVVRVEPGGESVSTQWPYRETTLDTSKGAHRGWATWVGPGSILGQDDGGYPYRPADGTRISLDFASWSTRLAGRVVSLYLADDSAVAWLERASTSDLVHLRWVQLGDDTLGPSARRLLARLATVNPSVGLSFGSNAEIERLLPEFQPRLLFISEWDSTTLVHVAAQTQIEELWIVKDGDLGDLGALRTLPHLRRLVIWGDLDSGQTAQIPRDLDLLSVLSEEALDAAQLGPMQRLRALSLSGMEVSGALDQVEMPELRHIAFPTNTTQDQFAAFLRAHPELETIDLGDGADEVTDLEPLRGLRRLRAVYLADDDLDLSVLLELKSLEFVGLSEDIWDSRPDQVVAIQQALQSAAVVRFDGLCLGSGWILLLVPFVAALTVRGRRQPRIAACQVRTTTVQ